MGRDFELIYMRIDPKKFFGVPLTIHATTALKIRDIGYEFFVGETPQYVTRRLLLSSPFVGDRSVEKTIIARLRRCVELAADIDFTLVRD